MDLTPKGQRVLEKVPLAPRNLLPPNHPGLMDPEGAEGGREGNPSSPLRIPRNKSGLPVDTVFVSPRKPEGSPREQPFNAPMDDAQRAGFTRRFAKEWTKKIKHEKKYDTSYYICPYKVAKFNPNFTMPQSQWSYIIELKRAAEREYVDPRPTREAPRHSTRTPAQPKRTNACAPSWHASNTFARGTVSMGRYFPTLSHKRLEVRTPQEEWNNNVSLVIPRNSKRNPHGNNVRITSHAKLTNSIQLININSPKATAFGGKVHLTTSENGNNVVIKRMVRGKIQTKLANQVRLVNWV